VAGAPAHQTAGGPAPGSVQATAIAAPAPTAAPAPAVAPGAPAAPPPGYPPGYSYPTAPGNAPIPIPYGEQRAARNPGWLVAGAVFGTLALVGIVVGLYLAVSGSSGGGTPTLTVPTAAAASVAAGHTSDPSEPRSAPSPKPIGGDRPASGQTPIAAAAATPTTSTPTPVDEAAEQQAVASTIQRHFSLIRNHRFAAAYALLAPNLQTGESTWVASHRSDGIYSVNVAVDATVHSPDSATAAILKMTTLDAHGCKNWSGSWGLTKIAGQWRISEANLSAGPC
jgi:hypothetical protein